MSVGAGRTGLSGRSLGLRGDSGSDGSGGTKKEKAGTKYSNPSPFLPLVFCFHWPNPTNEAGRLGSRSMGQPTEAQRRAEEWIAGRGGCSGQMANN